MLMLDPRVFPDGMDLQLTRALGDNLVNMHRPIAALRRDVFIHGIPGDTLYVVAMLHNLFDAFPIARGENSRDIIRATCEDVFPSGAPSEIIDLHRGASMGSI